MSDPLVFYTWKPADKGVIPRETRPIVRTEVVWTCERTGERQDFETSHALELLWRVQKALYEFLPVQKGPRADRNREDYLAGRRLPYGFSRGGKLYGRLAVQGHSYLRSTTTQRLTPQRCRQLTV